jgi:hypothetical protein
MPDSPLVPLAPNVVVSVLGAALCLSPLPKTSPAAASSTASSPLPLATCILPLVSRLWPTPTALPSSAPDRISSVGPSSSASELFYSFSLLLPLRGGFRVDGSALYLKKSAQQFRLGEQKKEPARSRQACAPRPPSSNHLWVGASILRDGCSAGTKRRAAQSLKQSSKS